MPTTRCRQIERKDAIFSIGRIAWLVLALQSGNVNNLRAGCEDKMHQPQRARQDAYKHVRWRSSHRGGATNDPYTSATNGVLRQ